MSFPWIPIAIREGIHYLLFKIPCLKTVVFVSGGISNKPKGTHGGFVKLCVIGIARSDTEKRRTTRPFRRGFTELYVKDMESKVTSLNRSLRNYKKILSY